MKLQLLINNVFIIFDNCAFKIQNSKKTRILDGVIGGFMGFMVSLPWIKLRIRVRVETSSSGMWGITDMTNSDEDW